MADFHIALGWLEIVAATATVFFMQAVTFDAGIDNTIKRWSAVRRTIYLLVSIALFCRGAFRLEDEMFVPWYDAACQSMVIFGFTFFPCLKALHVWSRGKLFSIFHAVPPRRVLQ